MSAVASLSTHPAESRSPASFRLGGVTVYGPNEEQLRSGLEALATAIERSSKQHPSLTRTTLNSLVRSDIGFEVDKRIFGAVLAWRLRLGHIDSIPCAAVSGKVYRVLVHGEQWLPFVSRLDFVKRQLRTHRVLQVHDAQQQLFRYRQWGTWSAASHLLAHLVQMGNACYLDSKTFAWPFER